MKVPYEDLGDVNKPYRKDLIEAATRVIDSGWFILGEEVSNFETEFAQWNSSPHCIGVASGLDALVLSLQALGIGHGDEVIVPSNTYIATILAIVKAGAKPVLAEPDPRTCNVDVDSISRAVTSATRAVIVVHLYGKPCNMDPIVQMCKESGLRLVEDCAQAHGATINGRKVGTFGDCGAFSFYPTKNLGALGDGGAILCRSSEINRIVRALRNYGSSVKYHNERIGVNSRLDEIQAAMLRVKLRYISRVLKHRRTIASMYFKGLKNAFTLPLQQVGIEDAFHIFQIRHAERDKLKDFLLEKGIGTEIHYPLPPHHQIGYRGFWSGSYPISENLHRTVLSLPISTAHSREQIEYVIQTMNAFG